MGLTQGGNMSKIILTIDRDLQMDLTNAGLDIERICRTALEAEAVHVRSKQAEADDHVLYQRGFAAGAEWAVDRASSSELHEIAEWSKIRWRQCATGTSAHLQNIVQIAVEGMWV